MPDAERRPPLARDCLDCGVHHGMKLRNVAATRPTNIPLLYVCDSCGSTLTVPPAANPLDSVRPKND